MTATTQRVFFSLLCSLIFSACGTVVGNGNKDDKSEDIEGLNKNNSPAADASTENRTEKKSEKDEISDNDDNGVSDINGKAEAGGISEGTLQEKYKDFVAYFKLLFVPGCTMPWDKLSFPLAEAAEYNLRKKGVDSTLVFSLEKDLNYAQGNLFTSTSKSSRIARYVWDVDVTSWDADDSTFKSTVEIEGSYACSGVTQIGTSENGSLTNYELQIDDPSDAEFTLSWSVRNDGTDAASIDKFGLKDIERDEVVMEGFLD